MEDMEEKIITSPILIKGIALTASNFLYYKYVVVRKVNEEYFFYDFAETKEKALIMASWYNNAYAVEINNTLNKI